MCQLMCGEIKNFTGKAQLFKDKFSHLVNQQDAMKQNDPVGASNYMASVVELKKNDLFDVGVVLTICATGGLDMVNEEQLSKLADFSQKCCLIHALNEIDPSKPGFETGLLSTLISLRRILNRISPGAQEFICLCMQ